MKKETPVAENQLASHKEFLVAHMPKYIRKYIFGSIRKRADLLPEQQDVLQDFYIYLVTESGVITRYHSYLNNIYTISLFGRAVQKPFNEVTKADIKNFLMGLHLRGCKESTLNEYRIKLRHFFTFLYGTNEYPDVVSWIQLAKTESPEISEDALITKTEVRKLAEAADNARDRALVTVLYESAARRSELLSVDLSHVRADRYGFVIKLPESKTKKRTVRLIESVPFLQEWLNNHPNKGKPESPVFVDLCKNYGGRMGPQCMRYILLKLAKHAGIKKKIYPHLFRHSRLNELAKDGFNERDLRLFAGWSEDSNMPKVYLHYGEKELHEKLLARAGVLTEEETKEEKANRESLKPRDCPRCKLVNPATSRYCTSCGMALSLKEYMADQEILRKETDERLKIYAEIMADPKRRAKYEEFKEFFLAMQKGPAS